MLMLPNQLLLLKMINEVQDLSQMTTHPSVLAKSA